MLSILLRFIGYYLRSTNLHGIHSPFVFSLVKDCVYNKKKFPEYSELKNYRNFLLKDKRVFTIQDFGAGGRNNTRKVRDIARISSSDLKKAALLYRLANYFKPAIILELGTNLGLGTKALSIGSPDAQVLTIEGDPSLSRIASELNTGSKIQFINDTFDHALPSILEKVRPSMVYIDGNHRYEPTIKYFEQLAAVADDHTVLIFDDIYWSAEMQKAYKYIRSSPKVHVTVDLFQVGLVFFRKAQTKEDFTVRF